LDTARQLRTPADSAEQIEQVIVIQVLRHCGTRLGEA
jgi:hypothetical protein